MSTSKTLGIACFTSDGKLLFIKKKYSYNYTDYPYFLEVIYEEYVARMSNMSFQQNFLTTQAIILEYLKYMTLNELLICLNINKLVESQLSIKRYNKYKPMIGKDLIITIHKELSIHDLIVHTLDTYYDSLILNKYYLPAGKPKTKPKFKAKEVPFETPLETAKREFNEETSILETEIDIFEDCKYEFTTNNYIDEMYEHTYYLARFKDTKKNYVKQLADQYTKPKGKREIEHMRSLSFDEVKNSNHQFRTQYMEIFALYNDYTEKLSGSEIFSGIKEDHTEKHIEKLIEKLIEKFPKKHLYELLKKHLYELPNK